MTRRRGYCYLVRPMRKGTTRARYKIRLQHAPRITAAKFPHPWRIKELCELALKFRFQL